MMITATCIGSIRNGFVYELSAPIRPRGSWMAADGQAVRAMSYIRVSTSVNEVVIRPAAADGLALRRYQGDGSIVWQFVPDNKRNTYWLYLDEVLRANGFEPAYPDVDCSPAAEQRRLEELVGVMRQYDPAGGGWSPRS